MQIEKIESKKKSMFVAEKILEAIQSGEYKKGDKLPAERIIAKEMKVGRSSVREAMTVLQTLGIVQRRAGDGNYVRRLPEDKDIKIEALSILKQNASPFEILDARRIIERGIVESAVERATPEEITQIEELFESMSEVVKQRDYNQYFNLNQEFHLAVARACKNPTVVSLLRFLFESMGQKLYAEMRKSCFLVDKRHAERSLANHKKIIIGFAKKDKKCAIRGIEKDCDELKRFLLK